MQRSNVFLTSRNDQSPSLVYGKGSVAPVH